MRTKKEILAEKNALNTIFKRLMQMRDCEGADVPARNSGMALFAKDVLDWASGDYDTPPSQELLADIRLNMKGF